MKTKKLLLPAVLLAATIAAYIVLTLVFCYNTKPKVPEGEFPFSITYEYLGETKNVSGVYKCKFSGSQTIFTQHERYWESDVEYTEGGYIIYQNEKKTVTIQPNVESGYYMGDPLYRDYYENYGLEGPTPYAEYYDYENDISYADFGLEEELASVGFRFIDYTYPEPIKNSFSFSGVEYEADNIIFFFVLMLLFLFACIIFVRKDKEYKYSVLDKIGIVLNFIVGFVAVPFIYIICTMYGLVGSGYEWIDQIIYTIPPFSVLCLALSVVFRRRGYSKTGFFIQLGGILAFIMFIMLDFI